MALIVVASHTHPLENCSNAFINSFYDVFIACAVQFFFLASGFMLGRKLEEPYNSEKDLSAISGYAVRMLKMYVIWSVVYLPLAIAEYLHDGKSFVYDIVLYIRGFIFTGSHHNSYALWYLLSMFYALVIIWILLKLKVSIKPILLIGFAIFLFGGSISTAEASESTFIIDRFFRLFKKITAMDGTFFSGLFFLTLGIFLADNEITLPQSIVMTLIGIIACFLKSPVFIYIVLCALGFFGIAINIKLPDSPVYSIIRQISTVMYFIHLWIWTVWYMVTSGKKTYGMTSFLATAIISTVIGLIYALVKRSLRNRRSSEA